jgi:hypothetical protein
LSVRPSSRYHRFWLCDSKAHHPNTKETKLELKAFISQSSKLEARHKKMQRRGPQLGQAHVNFDAKPVLIMKVQHSEIYSVY